MARHSVYKEVEVEIEFDEEEIEIIYRKLLGEKAALCSQENVASKKMTIESAALELRKIDSLALAVRLEDIAMDMIL